MHFSRKSKKKDVVIYLISFGKKAINFTSQQVFYSLKLTDLNANHFQIFTIKEKAELRLNSMVTPAIMNFRIFRFFVMWYNRAWQFISKKYKSILWFSFFFQIFERNSRKIHWDNSFCKGFPIPPPINADGSTNYTETMRRPNFRPTTLI